MCEMPYGSVSSKRSDAAALEEPAVATWTAWDSCRCGLDADGTFWIAPALGQREGTAKGEKRGTSVFTWFTRGIGHTQNKVRAVRVLYRLGSAAELDDLDLDASLADSVTLVEWGTGLVEQLTSERLEIDIERGGTTRIVTIRGLGARWRGVDLCALEGREVQ